MLIAFSISPSGGDESGGVSEAVAEAVRVVRASGLPCETNAMFTNIEGEWDEVMAVVKQAVDAVAASSPRVSLVLKADIRPGHTGQLTAKVQGVEERLAYRYDQPPHRPHRGGARPHGPVPGVRRRRAGRAAARLRP